MKVLSSGLSFPENTDKEVVALCDAMNSLPGIVTTESCCGHGKSPLHIFFCSLDNAGLFFLVRCIDKRYWRHGGTWGVNLYVSDVVRDNILPVGYVLSSGKAVGQEAYAQADSLVENMNGHLNNRYFMEGFGLHRRLHHFSFYEDEHGL